MFVQFIGLLAFDMSFTLLPLPLIQPLNFLQIMFPIEIILFLTGCVRANILQGDRRVLENATCELATLLAIFSFSTDAAEMATVFKTLSIFKAVLNSCKTLETVPVWLKEAKLASERLEILADQRGKEWLKELFTAEGSAATLDKVQKLKLQPTPAFQEALNVLKQAKTLEDVMKNEVSELKDDLSETSHYVKIMLTLVSLPIEDIRLFYPDAVDKLGNFQALVEERMDQVFSKIAALIKTGSSQIQKYRTAGSVG